MKYIKRFCIFYVLFFLVSCSMNSQKGQAVGFVTDFTRDGLVWKSWDLELHPSQTGMTSTSKEIDLSIDNENEDATLVNTLDSAQKYGWKVQIDYQQNAFTNCMSNRGTSSMFIKKIEILDKTPLGGIKGGNEFNEGKQNDTGKIPDTLIYIRFHKK